MSIDSKEYDRNTEVRMKVFTQHLFGQPVVAVDLDECLLATCHTILQYVNARCGTNYTTDHITQYDMAKTLGLDLVMFQDILHNSNYLRETQPFPHAVEFIQNLRSGKYNEQLQLSEDDLPYIVFITHRGFRPDGFLLTYELLTEIDLIPDHLIVCPMGVSKLDVLDDLYQDHVRLIVEDQPKILAEFLDAGIPVMKSVRPWNKDLWTDFHIDLTKHHLPQQVSN